MRRCDRQESILLRNVGINFLSNSTVAKEFFWSFRSNLDFEQER